MPDADANPANSSRTTAFIKASREAVYRAFLDPEALVAWQVPGVMIAKVHEFEARPGGGYRMPLLYSATEQEFRGKSAEWEVRFTARFVELTPPSRVVETISFETDDPAFAGEMTMEITLEERDGGAEATMAFANIPPGIRPEDNDAGPRSSREKLARYLESGSSLDA
jgi:uncharacterized protein YndB with AHSA1/START domain